jgi:class 3 adenylate cyclase
MESNHVEYNFISSFERIDQIIAESENSFEELKEVPSRDKLTFTNGFYVNCSALVIDIRGSSDLPEKHNRPKLAKLYRTFLSEVVAVMNGNSDCAEIFIVGDCVTGIFNTPYKSQVDSVFSTAARLSSLVDVMNYKFAENEIEQIVVGIGISDGRALMIKAGYKGSGINDIVWMGDVVNHATKLSGYGDSSIYDREMMVSSVIHQNLKDDNQSLLEWNSNRGCYHGNVINIVMNDWYEEHCQD